MTYKGHVEKGTIILDESVTLPEGAVVAVQVLYERLPSDAPPRKSWKGIFAGRGDTPSVEEIKALRREIWPKP